MDLGLANTAVAVAAGSRGIGFACAEAFALEGAHVTLCGRDAGGVEAAKQDLRQRSHMRVDGVTADVTRDDDVSRFVEAAAQDDRLDVLVTNAGGPPKGDFADTTGEDWDAAWQLSFRSTERLIRAALPYLRRSQRARIVTITSVSVRSPVDGLILSNAVRPAVVGLVRSLATELGPEGITVNNVAPGYTDTERVRSLFDARNDPPHVYAEKTKALRQRIPLGRLAAASEIAAAVAFLASLPAAYITGQTLTVDGGLHRGLF